MKYHDILDKYLIFWSFKIPKIKKLQIYKILYLWNYVFKSYLILNCYVILQYVHCLINNQRSKLHALKIHSSHTHVYAANVDTG